MLYKEQADGRGIGLEMDKELSFATCLSVAHGVAASSAFPPMFPPLEVDHRSLNCSKEEFPSKHCLTDGGVFDNLGMDRPLWWYTQQHPDPSDQLHRFLISDAEGPFKQVAGKPWLYKFVLPRNVRATEVLMKRNSALTWRFLSGQGLDLVRIPKPRQDSDLPGEQDLVQAIRTDLNRFSNLEVEALVRSGYHAARSALVESNWIPDGTADSMWCPVPWSSFTPEQRERELIAARSRTWIPLFFGFRDWAWWVILLTVLSAFLLIRMACGYHLW